MTNNTAHLGDCLNGCATCYDNYHAGFENLECDQCGKFIEPTAPQCGACGEYGNHVCVVELDYIADNTCESCKNVSKLNDLNLCEDCDFAGCGACGESFEITQEVWDAREYNHHFIEYTHPNCSEAN